MAELTRERLAAGSLRLWRDWLQDGLESYTRFPQPADRARAFLPLVVGPLSHYAAAELEREIRNLFRGKTARVARAAAQVLASWSVDIDGSVGAAIGIDLATRLNAPGLAAICCRIMVQPSSISEEEADRLAWVAIRAMKLRGSKGDIEELGRAISGAQLWTPSLVAEYGTVLGKRDLRALPLRLLDIVPIVAAEPHTGLWLVPLAERLGLEFPAHDLSAAFSRNLRDDEITFRFRQRLQDLTGSSDERSSGRFTPEQADAVIRMAAKFQPAAADRAEGVDEQFPPDDAELGDRATGNLL